MPKLAPHRLPAYRRHKASGQAVVTLAGKDHYLGVYGTKASKEAYDCLTQEWLANGHALPEATGQPTINELILAYLRHAESYYVKNGQPTDELACIKSALRPLKQLHGRTPAADFGPLAAKSIRERMIQLGWSRRYINKSMGRMRRMFKWGAENELVPSRIYHDLATIEGLKAGRTEAREPEARHPVSEEHLAAVKQHVEQWVRDLIDLQLFTGARPGEILAVTEAMLDRGPSIWTARLTDHKTAHHGKERVLVFGPQAQLIMRRYLPTKIPTGPIFPYRLGRYRDHVLAGCVKAGVPRWTPHWLRHTAGTHLRDVFGAETAQAILGHSRLDMTEHYAQKSFRLAEEAALKIG